MPRNAAGRTSSGFSSSRAQTGTSGSATPRRLGPDPHDPDHGSLGPRPVDQQVADTIRETRTPAHQSGREPKSLIKKNVRNWRRDSADYLSIRETQTDVTPRAREPVMSVTLDPYLTVSAQSRRQPSNHAAIAKIGPPRPGLERARVWTLLKAPNQEALDASRLARKRDCNLSERESNGAATRSSKRIERSHPASTTLLL